MPVIPKIIARLRKELTPVTRWAGQWGNNKYPVGTVFLSIPDAHVFAGYYDVSPFSQDNRYLLALSAQQDHTSPHTTNITADVGYFDLHQKIKQPVFHKIGETNSWNWQQGSRLQWVDADHVIYNQFDGQKFVSVLVNRTGNAVAKTIPYPVYAMHPSGQLMLSLSFESLHVFRQGYGYHQVKADMNNLKPDNDGIWQISLSDNGAVLLCSLRQIAEFERHPDMDGAFHYLNHVQYAPDGSSITFFHLWAKAGQKSKNVRMLIFKDGKLYNVDRDLRPSHPTWVDKSHFMVTGYHKMRNQMYHLYQINADNVTYVRSLPSPLEDGHPSFIDGQNFITDTYPDMFGFQHLFLCNQTGIQKSLSSFYLPPEFTGELRCDTHPRLSSGQSMIAQDVVINHKRSIALIPLHLSSQTDMP